MCLFSFRNYVSDFWPNPGTPTSKIQSMYHRLNNRPPGNAEKAHGNAGEAENIQRDALAAATNGQVNGDTVKSE